MADTKDAPVTCPDCRGASRADDARLCFTCCCSGAVSSGTLIGRLRSELAEARGAQSALAEAERAVVEAAVADLRLCGSKRIADAVEALIALRAQKAL